MKGEPREPLYRAVTFLLRLVGALLCLVGLTFPAGAQDSRVLQVWPDRSVGVTSGLLEGSAVYASTQVLPFGVCRTPTGDIVQARTYLHFPLEVFPPGTEVLRATLYAYVDSGWGTGEAEMGAYRVLESWEEMQWDGDPTAWPVLLNTPIAVAMAHFNVTTTTLSASTPASTGPPVSISRLAFLSRSTVPSLTAAGTSALSSRPPGRALFEDTVVTVDPLDAQVVVGDTTTVDIRVESVTGLHGAEVYLSFDPMLLEVVDDDPDAEGVQIQPGTFLSPDFVSQNLVDHTTGEIEFSLSQLPPHGPVSGSGVLATITFQGKAVGTSALTFIDVVLSDDDGEAISAEVRDGDITVVSATPPAPVLTPMPTLTPTPTSPASLLPTPTSPTSPLPTPTSTPTPAPGPTSTPASSPTSTPTSAPSPTAPVLKLGQVMGTWLTWDVTALMRAWLTSEVADYGLSLGSTSEAYADPETAGDLLLARWLTAEDTGTRPYLIVDFKINPVTPTSVPILPPAGNSTGWGGVGLFLLGVMLLILGLTGRKR